MPPVQFGAATLFTHKDPLVKKRFGKDREKPEVTERLDQAVDSYKREQGLEAPDVHVVPLPGHRVVLDGPDFLYFAKAVLSVPREMAIIFKNDRSAPGRIRRTPLVELEKDVASSYLNIAKYPEGPVKTIDVTA